MPDPTRIAVIIPYFQREPGLLRRALESVIAQKYQPAQVVVVDDGSPRPASEEITASHRERLPGLTVIVQENRRIGAARNAALEALEPNITAVALLDSDDAWEPSHLEHAAEALAQGADFFFSNARVDGEAEDHFHLHSHRELLCRPRPIGRWSGSVFELFRHGIAFRTPTVVFRRSIKPDARFPTHLRRAGEDHIFFWDLLVRAHSIMFCSEVTVVYGGKGVGTWRNATYGSRENLIRVADEISARKLVLSRHALSRDDRSAMRKTLNAGRGAALYPVLHLLRRRNIAIKEIAYLLRADPICVLVWCVELPKAAYRWTRAR